MPCHHLHLPIRIHILPEKIRLGLPGSHFGFSHQQLPPDSLAQMGQMQAPLCPVPLGRRALGPPQSLVYGSCTGELGFRLESLSKGKIFSVHQIQLLIPNPKRGPGSSAKKGQPLRRIIPLGQLISLPKKFLPCPAGKGPTAEFCRSARRQSHPTPRTLPFELGLSRQSVNPTPRFLEFGEKLIQISPRAPRQFRPCLQIRGKGECDVLRPVGHPAEIAEQLVQRSVGNQTRQIGTGR